jgi:PEP-CTERM motif
MKVAVALLAFALSGAGATITTTVNSTAEPWMWSSGGLNSGFQYGVLNGSAPVVIGASDGLSFAAGSMVTLTYLSGLASTCAGCPSVDANGWTAAATNDKVGSSGNPYPSKFMSPYPIYLMALVGTFADGTGAIVGTPFFVGTGPVSFAVPAGATQLLLGMNDDFFLDNTGSLSVQVADPTGGGGSIPEPASILLLGFGLAAGAGMHRIMRRRKSGL